MIEKVKDNKLKNIIFIRDGVYEIQISNGFREDGHRDRITETFYGDEDGAIIRRDEIKEELKRKKEKGQKTASDSYTFLEVTKFFLEDRKYSKRVGTTVRGYKNHLNNYILPEIGFKKLRNITTEDIENLYNKMSQQISKRTKNSLSGTTIKHSHSLIMAIFNYAIHKKWIFYNPANFVENKPKFDTKEREYYDHEEINHALNCLNLMSEHKNGISDRILHLQNLRFKVSIVLLFNGGLRKEELFGLKWKDIKWSTNIIEIHRAIVAIDVKEFNEEDIIEVINKNLICKKLKNESSRRNITLPMICFDYLMEYRKAEIEYGLPASDDDYILQNVRVNIGTMWNPSHLSNEWADFIKQFNLKKITVHDIRHSHATDLLSMGVPIQDVSRRLGHSDVATTLKIYTHSNMGQDKLIAQKLEERYENKYVTNKLNFKVIASIISDEYYANEQEIINGVNYISGEIVNESNKKILFSECKQYLLENYEYLKNILVLLNKDTEESLKQSFFDLISNLNVNLGNIRPMRKFS